MTSGYIPSQGEPGPDEILEALRAALGENPRLVELIEEEVARQLVLGGHLEQEPSPPLVAEALQLLEAEEGITSRERGAPRKNRVACPLRARKNEILEGPGSFYERGP